MTTPFKQAVSPLGDDPIQPTLYDMSQVSGDHHAIVPGLPLFPQSFDSDEELVEVELELSDGQSVTSIQEFLTRTAHLEQEDDESDGSSRPSRFSSSRPTVTSSLTEPMSFMTSGNLLGDFKGPQPTSPVKQKSRKRTISPVKAPIKERKIVLAQPKSTFPKGITPILLPIKRAKRELAQHSPLEMVNETPKMSFSEGHAKGVGKGKHKKPLLPHTDPKTQTKTVKAIKSKKDKNVPVLQGSNLTFTTTHEPVTVLGTVPSGDSSVVPVKPTLVYGMDINVFCDLPTDTQTQVKLRFNQKESKRLAASFSKPPPIQTIVSETVTSQITVPTTVGATSTSKKSESKAAKIVLSGKGGKPVEAKKVKKVPSLKETTSTRTVLVKDASQGPAQTSVTQSVSLKKQLGTEIRHSNIQRRCAFAPTCNNTVPPTSVHNRCKLCLGKDHDPFNCDSCANLSTSRRYRNAAFFREWRDSGRPPVATPSVPKDMISPRTVSQEILPVRAKLLVHPPVVAQSQAPQVIDEDISMDTQPPIPQEDLVTDHGPISGRLLDVDLSDPPILQTPVQAQSVLSTSEVQYLNELEAHDEQRSSEDFHKVMLVAGSLLQTPFVSQLQQRQGYVASLRKDPPPQTSISVPLTEEFHDRVDELLTSDKLSSTLDKEDVILPWASLKRLYRIDNDDYKSLCDPSQAVHADTVPLITALGQGTQINVKPKVATALHSSAQMTTRVATYIEVLGSALSVGFQKAITALGGLADSTQDRNTAVFAQELKNSLDQFKPLASAVADASRDIQKLQSRGIARAIHLRRKAVLPQAVGSTASSILRQPVSAKCLMGEDFVNVQSNLADVQHKVALSARSYLNVSKRRRGNKPKHQKTQSAQVNSNQGRQNQAKAASIKKKPFRGGASNKGATNNKTTNANSQRDTSDTSNKKRGGSRGGRGSDNKRGGKQGKSKK